MESLESVLVAGSVPPAAQALYGTGFLFIFIFVLSSMFATGLSATLADLIAPIRDRRLLGVTFLVNFILVPLLALLLIALIPMNRQLAGGLLLVSIAAGAPSTMKVAEITGGNIPRAVSLTILMTLVTVILMPLFLPYVLPGAQTDQLEVMVNLVVLILIPILLGLLLRSRWEELADRLTPVVIRISDVAVLVIFLTLGIVLLFRMGDFASSTSGAIAIPVAIVFTLGALGAGYLFGSLSEDSREEIAFGAGSRNITAALVVIFASYANARNDVLLMVLMVTFFSVLIISVLAGLIYRKRYGIERLWAAFGA
ncbi:MAG: bile acid:sodium symporter [Methanomicrobiales archaeon]|nr:bile acid:sodium symporter [Methanomicrobiales archaeon]